VLRGAERALEREMPESSQPRHWRTLRSQDGLIYLRQVATEEGEAARGLNGVAVNYYQLNTIQYYCIVQIAECRVQSVVPTIDGP
jgi:hypothetical protein